MNSLGNVIFNSSVTSMKLKIKNNQSTRLNTINDLKPPAKSGITAIDDHYDNIRDDIEIEKLRYTTEFRRLIHLVQTFWTAKKFPSCEKKYVMNVLKILTKNAKFNSTSEKLVDQLEEYYKFI